MALLKEVSRIDQVVIAIGDDGFPRGVHVSRICSVLRDGDLVSSWHETAPFDPAQLGDIIPAADSIKRAIDLEVKIESERSDHAEQIDQLHRAYADQLSAERDAHAALVARMASDHAAELAALRASIGDTDAG